MTVLKHVTCGEFKDALIALIGQSLSRDLVQIAEVRDSTIIRVLVSFFLQHNTRITGYLCDPEICGFRQKMAICGFYLCRALRTWGMAIFTVNIYIMRIIFV